MDTGSQVTTISASLANRSSSVIKPLNSLVTIKTAGGNILPYLGYAEISLNLAPGVGFPIDSLVLVIDDENCDPQYEVVIGTNVLKIAHTLLPELKSVSQPVRQAVSLLAMNATGCKIGTVKVTNSLVLPAKSKVVVHGTTVTNSNLPKMNAVTEASVEHQLPGGILVSQCLVSVGNGSRDVGVELVNVSSRERHLQCGSILCDLHMAEVETSTNTPADESSAEEWLSKFQWPDDPVQAEAIRSLVIQYRDVFSTHSLDYGQTNLVEHRIDLNDENSQPIKIRHRRIPPSMIEEVREYLDELIAAKQIQPSKSPWSFPLVLVRKKDGSLRFVIDYRRLNILCKRDSFSLPRLDETMDALIGAQYFSKLDLKSGYYQIPMNESHKERTAFSAGPLGFYEWNSMPMGTVNATSTFQRLMQQCLGNMHLKECVVFLDDILVYASTFEEHLKRLHNVFQRLRDCGLKLKPSKCEFLKSHCNYLGHVVSAEGISTDPNKIDKVKNWKTPVNAKELSSFLGFASFYRRFVDKFSNVAKPLQDALKSADKKGNITWTEDTEAAFKLLKQKLTMAPILAYADYTLPFILHVDASGTGLGAVLYQEQQGKQRVIAYASRGLNAAEKNYPAHKREFLALKWAIVDKFHDYLYMSKCQVFSDSNPLTYILTTAKLDATGHRWLAYLSSYDFSIHYKPGATHKDADALSRLDSETTQAICKAGQESDGCCLTLPLGAGIVEDVVGSKIPSDVFAGDVAGCQRSDVILNKLVAMLKGKVVITEKELKEESVELQKLVNQKDKLIIKNGVLYRKVIQEEGEILQCVIPIDYRKPVFQALHHRMGHPGRDKTLALHRARCYWPSMAKDIESMVQKCRRCVCRKARATTAPLTPIVTSEPLELVCLDFLLVEPSSGYEHILVITDHFTKFSKAIATKNESALTTARALYQNFITVYGVPTRIMSDQGRNFESKLIKELCTITGMDKSRTTPYHAMSNGACERMNQTLLKLLGTLSEDKKAKWKEYLPSMVHAYNCTPHETTGYSPYELMFGRKPILPIDVEMMPPNEVAPLSKFVSDLQEHVKYSQELAGKKLAQKAIKAKEKYDKRAVAAGLQPGDTVLIKKTTSSGREKLADRWVDDIHIVLSQPNPNIAVYKVKPSSRAGRVRTLHRNLLLPVSVDEEEDDVSQEPEPVRPNNPASRSRPKSSNPSPNCSESSDSEYELFVAPPRRTRSQTAAAVPVDNIIQDENPPAFQPPAVQLPAVQQPAEQEVQPPIPPSPPQASPPPTLRRSGRPTQQPVRYNDYVMY